MRRWLVKRASRLVGVTVLLGWAVGLVVAQQPSDLGGPGPQSQDMSLVG